MDTRRRHCRRFQRGGTIPPDPPPTPEGAAVPDNVGGPPSLSLPRTANMAALTKSTTMVHHIVLPTAMCVPLFA